MTDPTMVENLMRRLRDRGLLDLPSKEGDLTGYAETFLRDLSQKKPQQVLDAMVSEMASGMMPSIARTFPELGKAGAIRVRQVVDRRIDAVTSKKPPYDVVVSSSLVAFVSSMINALMSGVGIALVGDEGRPESPTIKPRPLKSVASDIKQALNDHIAGRPIPFLDSDASGARYMIQFRNFHCALSWALGHEMGHVVVTESRHQMQQAPFEPFARGHLENHFEQLLADERFRDAVGPLTEVQRLSVFDRWLTEINADILGASLACGYQKDYGISRDAPDVVGFTKLAIHLILMSQYILDAYMNLFDERHKLASRTHPPMDFRMHCVLAWMYRDQVREATAGVVDYVQKVFTEVLRQAGAKV